MQIGQKFMPQGLNRFEKIFYINLAHRTDRNAFLLQELQKMGVEPQKIVRIEGILDVLNGHRGCALSHIHALKLAQQMGLQEVLILEDDAYFHTDQEEIEKHLSLFFQHAPSYDMLLLGARVEQYQSCQIEGIYRAIIARLAHAYVVKNHYIPKLLEVFENTYKTMLKIPTFNQVHDKAIDRAWDPLFEKDLILFTKIFAYQRGGYSDIQRFTHEDNFKYLKEVD